jgi:hypothetical protein
LTLIRRCKSCNAVLCWRRRRSGSSSCWLPSASKQRMISDCNWMRLCPAMRSVRRRQRRLLLQPRRCKRSGRRCSVRGKTRCCKAQGRVSLQEQRGCCSPAVAAARHPPPLPILAPSCSSAPTAPPSTVIPPLLTPPPHPLPLIPSARFLP